MKYKIYEYIGKYGASLDAIKLDENSPIEKDDDYELVGIWDLPEDFVDKCLPISYME